MKNKKSLLIVHDVSGEELYDKGVKEKVERKFQKIANSFEKCVIIIPSSKKDLNVKNAKIISINIFFWFLLPIYSLFYHLKYDFGLIRVYKPFYSSALCILSSKLIRVPVIVSVHGFWGEISKDYPIIIRLMKNLLETFVLKNADFIICASGNLKKYVENIRGGDVEFIPTWGCDTGLFIPEYNQGTFDKENSVNVISVGRVEKVKNFELAIESIYYSKRLAFDKKIQLFVIGPIKDLKYYKELKRLMNNLEVQNNVIFTGGVAQRELVNYYKKADCLLMTSKTEGLPHPILESLSMNIPVVSANVGDCSLLIKEGKNGYLFENGSYAKEVAELILKCVNIKVESMYGRDIILKEYSEEVSIDNEIKFLGGLIDGKEKILSMAHKR